MLSWEVVLRPPPCHGINSDDDDDDSDNDDDYERSHF